MLKYLWKRSFIRQTFINLYTFLVYFRYLSALCRYFWKHTDIHNIFHTDIILILILKSKENMHCEISRQQTTATPFSQISISRTIPFLCNLLGTICTPSYSHLVSRRECERAPRSNDLLPHRQLASECARSVSEAKPSSVVEWPVPVCHAGLTHRCGRCQRIVSQESRASPVLTGKYKEYTLQLQSFHSRSWAFALFLRIRRRKTLDDPFTKRPIKTCGMKPCVGYKLQVICSFAFFLKEHPFLQVNRSKCNNKYN